MTADTVAMETPMNRDECVAIHWFRHGLRIHDNPALLEAISKAKTLYPVFIFDGKVAGTWNSGYNRWRFLLQSLEDLDRSFREWGGRLWIFHGDSKEVLIRLIPLWGVTHVSFELDLEPIWQRRDCKVINQLKSMNVRVIEGISYTLWDPREIIKANGGSPPLTFGLFMLTSSVLGDPPPPREDPDFTLVTLPDKDPRLPEEMIKRNHVPTLEEMGVDEDIPGQKVTYIWQGGEREALAKLRDRVETERDGISKGNIRINIYKPNLVGASRSLSPYIRFGCLSVRLFYKSMNDLASKDRDVQKMSPIALTAQLIWREYFYTMSINNPHFHKIENNPVCLPVPWRKEDDHLAAWKAGKTGYPWIDALQRQLVLEGWTHHVGRHASACFLTRGDLWITWEVGAQHFIKYQIDGDWAVGIGNWMWVSSSAFEKALDCSKCMSPVTYGQRMDPKGVYIRKYIPELKDMPLRYLFHPWDAPEKIQEQAGCMVGKDYPRPIVDHKFVSKRNSKWMEEFKEQVIERIADHIRPTTYSEEELKMCVLDAHAINCPSGSDRNSGDDSEQSDGCLSDMD